MKCIKCNLRDPNAKSDKRYCIGCYTALPYLEKYPVLKDILLGYDLREVSQIQSGFSTDKTRVRARCLKCDDVAEVDLVSLSKVIRRNMNSGAECLYQCHSCSKKTDFGINLSSLSSVINVEARIQKYGGMPINLKKGNVIAVCEDCKKENDIRASSLYGQARRHKLSGRSVVYKCFSCGVNRPDAVQAGIDGRLKQLKDGQRSNLEVALANRLNAMGLKYEEQYSLDMYTWDFYLPDHNALIDVDGEYWHSLKENVAKDKSKITYTNKYHPEFVCIKVPERYFLNPMGVDRFIRSHIDVQDVTPVDFEFAQVEVLKCDSGDEVPGQFLMSFHYAGGGRKPRHVYGAYLQDSLIAVAKFSPVVRNEVVTSVNLTSSQALELDRFCIHPNYQKKNLASWFLSRSTGDIFKSDPKIRAVITFADSTYGHSGAIYKASNWALLHKTKDSYHYMGSDGIVINKKRVHRMASKLKMKESEYVKKHSLTKFRENEKYKFMLSKPNA